jgi:DNA polymerase III epsilon subunit-like protein
VSDQHQLVCIDIETNGLSMDDDILSISVRALNADGTPTDIEFYSLIYTEQDINPDAFHVNGISKGTLLQAPKKHDVLFDLQTWHAKQFFGAKLSPMGHNFIGFDKPRVEKLLGPVYNKIFHYHVDDSMILARALQRTGMLPVESCSLKNLAAFFNVKPLEGVLHNASADTYVCGLVYARLLKILKPSALTRFLRNFYPNYLGV